jgi:hypothetical protein
MRRDGKGFNAEGTGARRIGRAREFVLGGSGLAEVYVGHRQECLCYLGGAGLKPGAYILWGMASYGA